MGEFTSCKKHFLVYVRHQSLRVDVSNGFKFLVLKVFLHFGHVAHAFFGKTLELCDVDVTTIHRQSGVFWQMHLLQQVMIVFCGGCELHHHRHADMILHYRMYFHAAFFLA